MAHQEVSETRAFAQADSTGSEQAGVAATPPRVSIGIPVYNGENHLEELLESLRAQTFENFEAIISDNASTDRTADICRTYLEKDPRFRYFRNAENVGAIRNYRRCFELARSPYFKWANHDDLYAPTFLERCVEVLDRCPDVVLAHTMVDAVDFTGQDLLKEHRGYALGVIESLRDSEGRLVWVMGPLHLAESASPAKRFHECLWRLCMQSPFFGVIRADVLRTVTLDEYYYGFDRVVVLELALRGQFHQVEERCFINRFHLGCSRFLSSREMDKFANPQARVGMRQLRQYRAILRAPLTTNLSLSQKLHCQLDAIYHIARRSVGQFVRWRLFSLRAYFKKYILRSPKKMFLHRFH
jgi:glycosyltransferase involved in cell wall biosynthesis